MLREKVTSSNLSSIGYDLDYNILEIEFNSGGIYQYIGLPQNVFEELMGAVSKGSYFQKHIRDQYKSVKVR